MVLQWAHPWHWQWPVCLWDGCRTRFCKAVLLLWHRMGGRNSLTTFLFYGWGSVDTLTILKQSIPHHWVHNYILLSIHERNHPCGNFDFMSVSGHAQMKMRSWTRVMAVKWKVHHALSSSEISLPFSKFSFLYSLLQYFMQLWGWVLAITSAKIKCVGGMHIVVCKQPYNCEDSKLFIVCEKNVKPEKHVFM